MTLCPDHSLNQQAQTHTQKQSINYIRMSDICGKANTAQTLKPQPTNFHDRLIPNYIVIVTYKSYIAGDTHLPIHKHYCLLVEQISSTLSVHYILDTSAKHTAK